MFKYLLKVANTPLTTIPMKNARTFIKSLEHNLSNLIARGVKASKKLDQDQQELVNDMIAAADNEVKQERLNGYKTNLLAMQVITFINTL